MTYAIIELATKTVVRDAVGYPHLYSCKENAEFAWNRMGRPVGLAVVPW